MSHLSPKFCRLREALPGLVTSHDAAEEKKANTVEEKRAMNGVCYDCWAGFACVHQEETMTNDQTARPTPRSFPSFLTVLKAIALAEGKLSGSPEYLTKYQMIWLAKSVLSEKAGYMKNISSITRYTEEGHESPGGTLIFYSDYETLEAKTERLNSQCLTHISNLELAKVEIERLTTELAAKDATIKELERQLEAAQSKMRERCAKEVPTNWLDPLLTGDAAVITNTGRYSEGDIEDLLLAVAARIRALSTDPKEPIKESAAPAPAVAPEASPVPREASVAYGVADPQDI